MTCWAVIPVKAPAACKTRLSAVLEDGERCALVAGMLGHVVGVAAATQRIDEVLLLGPARHGLPDSMRLLADPGLGLNAALRSAIDAAVQAAVSRLLFVAADLPHLQPADVVALLDVPDDAGAIAPDRAGTGTNALSLPVSCGPAFGLHYGIGSLAAHRGEARRIGLDLRVIRSPSLAFDIDVPADLDRLRERPILRAATRADIATA